MNEISPKLRNRSGGFMVMPRHVVRVQKFDYVAIGTSEEVKKA